jgi:hypothetical protein
MAILEKKDVTDLKANPKKMEFVSGHWEVAKEDTIVKPVKGRKKCHRDRHVEVGWRGEPNELTRENCRSWMKLTAAYRRLSRRTAVAWNKGNIIRKIRTQENCGHSQQEDHPTCKSGTAQGTRTSDRSKKILHRELRGKNVQEETMERPGMQNWNKEPRRPTAAISEE